MRNLFMSAVLIAALGSSTFAATYPPAATRAGPSPTALAPDVNAKREACADSWRRQATHVGTRAVFMKACVNKG